MSQPRIGSTHGTFQLPDERVLRLYLDAYKTSLTTQNLFPVIDTDLFEDSIDSVYRQHAHGPEGDEHAITACINSFLIFCVHSNPIRKIVERSLRLVANKIADDVKYSLPIFLMKQPASLEVAQAFTMLVGPILSIKIGTFVYSLILKTLVEFFTGQSRSAHYLLSVSAQSLVILGASAHLSTTRIRNRICVKRYLALRNLFWLCYTVDKDLCLRTGLAFRRTEFVDVMILIDAFCDRLANCIH